MSKIKKTNQKEYCAIFSSQDIAIEDAFTGCELSAVFGGLKLDLTNAKVKEDIIINASSIFGGIDILIPENIQVKII